MDTENNNSEGLSDKVRSDEDRNDGKTSKRARHGEACPAGHNIFYGGNMLRRCSLAKYGPEQDDLLEVAAHYLDCPICGVFTAVCLKKSCVWCRSIVPDPRADADADDPDVEYDANVLDEEYGDIPRRELIGFDPTLGPGGNDLPLTFFEWYDRLLMYDHQPES
jgi:hypothetical protein